VLYGMADSGLGGMDLSRGVEVGGILGEWEELERLEGMVGSGIWTPRVSRDRVYLGERRPLKVFRLNGLRHGQSRVEAWRPG